MRISRLILTKLCILVIVTGQTTDMVEETEEPEVTIDAENTELDSGPVTEQVMEPNITINRPGEPETDETEDESSDEEPVDPSMNVNRVIRDIAYYLRAHKFQDYDRRYFKSLDDATTFLYEEFPKPPLRSLHWEVQNNCEAGFNKCLRYLEGIIRMTSLRRNDDTVTIMRENKWNVKKNNQQILASQKDCQIAQRRDNLTIVPFQGPIERFQWRTSASYYMCWFTMLGTPDLEYFGESCSNHANCLDTYGADNQDPRANDDKPFACALYSFCPDHCCPKKHIWYMRDCFQSQSNPCWEENQPADRKCTLNREENQDFESLIQNHINITCNCYETGYEWSSRFGLCVDVNECTRDLHDCKLDAGQICVNQPGSYTCICNIGFVFNSETQSCIASPLIEKALRPSEDDEDESKPEDESTFALIVKALTRSSAVDASQKHRQKRVFSQLIFITVEIFLRSI